MASRIENFSENCRKLPRVQTFFGNFRKPAGVRGIFEYLKKILSRFRILGGISFFFVVDFDLTQGNGLSRPERWSLASNPERIRIKYERGGRGAAGTNGASITELGDSRFANVNTRPLGTKTRLNAADDIRLRVRSLNPPKPQRVHTLCKWTYWTDAIILRQ